MKRTNFYRRPSAILTSDWHIREDIPTCYPDGGFQEDQWAAVEAIRHLQLAYDCPILHPGDLFDYWKPSPSLLSMTMLAIPKQFYTVYGQHDLPQHSLKLKQKSGMHTLEVAKKVTVLPFTHYGEMPNMALEFPQLIGHKILVWHHLTYMTQPYPGATGGNAKGILRKYPQFDLIVTGDNHTSFWVEYQGRLLVNPGPITRQTAKQIDYKPRVYLWFKDTNTVIPHYLPFTEGIISREHIDKKEKRDNRIDAYISKLDGEWQAELTFEDNLKRFKEVNLVRKPVLEIINKSIEE